MRIGYHVHNPREKLPIPQVPIQIFYKSPMNIKSRGILNYKIFKDYNMPIFTHATYAVNLGSNLSTAKLNQLSKNLIDDLQFLDRLPDGRGTILHYRKGQNLMSNIEYILSQIEEAGVKSKLILENVKGTTIGDMYEIQRSFKGRIGFCFDTCHLFISGYDLRDLNILGDVCTELKNSFPDLMLLHYNDSNSLTKDIHAVPNEGYIGNKKLGGNPKTFAVLKKKFKNIPLIMEIN